MGYGFIAESFIIAYSDQLKLKRSFIYNIAYTFQFFDSFHATGLYLYPLKTTENLLLPDVFRGIERDEWNKMG